MINLKIVSSLEKVLPKFELNANETKEITALAGETVSFQVAYSSDMMGRYGIKIETDNDTNTKLYFVKNVPVGMATLAHARGDNNYLSHEPGLFPDVLEPADRDWVQVHDIWNSVWITVNAKEGIHNIKVTFSSPFDEEPVSVDFTVNIIKCELPEQELVFTQWFHCDCIATHYGCEIFSEEHWKLIEKFLRLGAQNGINMILTPVFTPPLDTEIGGERPTVQLLDIEKSGDTYKFDFSKLLRWVNLCKSIGFKYFEMPHLFTQWGAKATPKIIAVENGREKRIFGWDVASDTYEYDNFLSQMIPALRDFLFEQGIADKTYFHISDEPNKENMETYRKAKDVAEKYLDGCKVIEALLDPELYLKGFAKIPVPEICNMKEWIKLDLPERWCYYCCGDVIDVSNRMIAMPSARNRSIGVQLYKYKATGFLHWGYNFYYSQNSHLVLNPYNETDAHGAFPSGDAFSVYPGKDGAIPAIGLVVFNEALQDIRALKALEKIVGYDAVISLIEETLGDEITFYKCFDADKLLNMRKIVNEQLNK